MDAERNAGGAYVALGGGLAIIALFGVLMGSTAGTVVYLLGGAYGTTLSIVGARRMPPARRHIWWAFAVAQMMCLLGDSLFSLYEDVLHIDPFPSIADLAYLAQYPALALGMLWLIRKRRRGRDRAAFLDAAILTTGLTVVGTVFLVTPAAALGGTTRLSQFVAAAYPAGDLLVLALAVGMLTAGIARNDALWTLVVAMAALLVADVVYVASVVNESAYPSWIDFGYLISYMALGFAALHPSADLLSEPGPDRPSQVTVLRLAMLGGALMMAPLTSHVAHLTGVSHGKWVVFVGGCVAALLVVLRLGDLVQDLQRKAIQLAALARRDSLTGVPNRRTWDHELSRACAIAREEGTPLTVAVLDMDNFKRFNDTFGHLKGDLVLKETAAAWSSILQGRGVLARFGGEEFTALIPNVAAHDSTAVLEELRRAVSHGQTCSIGAATWDGVETPGGLVSRADQALYHAKRSGRDRIAMAEGQSAAVVAQIDLADPALPSLRSVYQPIVDLRSGEMVGREALSRFAGQEAGEVFARAARDGTGSWLETAAIRSALAGWDGEGLLALNVSPHALLKPHVRDALPPDLDGIVIEITEADLDTYTTEVMLVIDELRAAGALIAIDDFGVGFSNIHRVVTIRPDIVKLDMSLIRGIDADSGRQAVIAGAMVFATQTKSQVVAEGIETPAELDCLIRLGVRFGQGYLLGMPEPLLITPQQADPAIR
ncbi:EAL domain-containing protein [Nocardioides sp. HM23]|uniref:EAL domain-containing protein n=1 Tax=Nocardioides bizhenqiangii TaxID=3095076 RepID=UPI002ACA7812|nr:EAL domain-containing protein [Nocardioides sp. HM23]MDZ5622089.1 EAL domain-containing protein [Nocardioides sp. HM23]